MVNSRILFKLGGGLQREGLISKFDSEGKGLLQGGLNRAFTVRILIWGERPSGLYSLRQVTEVKFGRVRSNSGWVTSEV